MKRTWMISSLLVLAATATFAADQPNGYRDCSPQKLAACQNSNQLFWGLEGKHGKSTAKPEIRQALAAFLHQVPPLYVDKIRFDPARIAADSFVGPGDHHDRLPGGGWFFDGFTPHDAAERCAIIFSAGGQIQLLALLDIESGDSKAGTADPDLYYLHVYSHDAAPDAAGLRLVRSWADDRLKSYQTKPASRLAATELFTRGKDTWNRRVLP